jgi:NDP-4-keto-2,6-dideoxyhexose 3-C-methyltransferase
MNYKKINQCRICGNQNLEVVLDLGHQVLTGVFPKTRTQEITKGPIQLIKCIGESKTTCGLLQMAHSYDLDEMYGENYGYRSGLNQSMVTHLKSKIEKILTLVSLDERALVLDIGSNDGTSLSFYPENKCTRVGMDPTASKFLQYYPVGVHVIPDFFSADRFRRDFAYRKARVVTSFSMFYDLERPADFVNEVAQILDAEGVWVFEQSYMPLMLERNSFDTACHEHLEYYAFKQIHWMLEKANLKTVDIKFNDVNGGSFSVTAALKSSKYPVFPGLDKLLSDEAYLDDISTYTDFARRVDEICRNLKKFVQAAKMNGKKVAGLGASTKGNVLLQYCAFTSNDLFAIAEVNPDKFGTFTPGSLIPIRPDTEVIEQADFLIVLPWHFKNFFLEKYSFCKEKLMFPLPGVESI